MWGWALLPVPVEMQFNLNASLVNPYYSETTAKLDFSFIRFMNSWFQVTGSGSQGKTKFGERSAGDGAGGQPFSEP